VIPIGQIPGFGVRAGPCDRAFTCIGLRGQGRRSATASGSACRPNYVVCKRHGSASVIDKPGHASHDDDTASSVASRAGIRLGQLRPRSERVGHNARWHLVSDGQHWFLGWGDLSESDLHRVRIVLGRALFLGPVRVWMSLPGRCTRRCNRYLTGHVIPLCWRARRSGRCRPRAASCGSILDWMSLP